MSQPTTGAGPDPGPANSGVFRSVVPPYLLRGIAASEANPPEIRESARRTLLHNQALRQSGGTLTTLPGSDGAGGGPAGNGGDGSSGAATTAVNPRSIVPPSMLQGIANSTEVDEATRDSARRTLEFLANISKDGAGGGSSAAGLDFSSALKAGEATATTPRASDAAASKTQRSVWSMLNYLLFAALPGKWLRDENYPANNGQDWLVVQTWANMAATLTMYESVFGREGIDGKGGPTTTSIHYGQMYADAFWVDSKEQLIFGDGNAILGHFAESTTIMGHEMTHGLVNATAKLIYYGQSGALDESFADVCGVVTEQLLNKQSSFRAKWLIGEECLLPGIKGVALRSMSAPGTAYDDPRLNGKDQQVAHMEHYILTTEDSGGVHWNSGIPNHAFFLFARAMGGHAYELPAKLWYATITDPGVGPNCDFNTFATIGYGIAVDHLTTWQAERYRGAWANVGINLKKIKPVAPVTHGGWNPPGEVPIPDDALTLDPFEDDEDSKVAGSAAKDVKGPAQVQVVPVDQIHI